MMHNADLIAVQQQTGTALMSVLTGDCMFSGEKPVIHKCYKFCIACTNNMSGGPSIACCNNKG